VTLPVKPGRDRNSGTDHSIGPVGRGETSGPYRFFGLQLNSGLGVVLEPPAGELLEELPVNRENEFTLL